MKQKSCVVKELLHGRMGPNSYQVVKPWLCLSLEVIYLYYSMILFRQINLSLWQNIVAEAQHMLITMISRLTLAYTWVAWMVGLAFVCWCLPGHVLNLYFSTAVQPSNASAASPRFVSLVHDVLCPIIQIFKEDCSPCLPQCQPLE